MADDFRPVPGAPPPAPPSGRARTLLTRRLADIVCLPASRVPPQERWMVADVLETMLASADVPLRAKVAARLAEQGEAPAGIVRRLALDEYEIAEPLLTRARSLSDFDMMEIARKTGRRHRLALARRECVSELVAAALCAGGDTDVIAALLRNAGAHLAMETVEFLVREAAENETLSLLLIKRPELRPAQALTLFWACGHDQRRMILDRFAASRAILQEAASDVFPLARQHDERDPAVDAALVYIDRRQRDRRAAELSPYQSLEGLIEHAAREGLRLEARAELATLAAISQELTSRMLDDFGGEPLAVLAKATGLSREHLVMLIELGVRTDAPLRIQQGVRVFDTLSVDKAQTVLRYWNWVIGRAGAA
ncbi:MAG: DUF2336 domain-containing protein [Alphaproteobacteria bacterium]|nr:DUF2336 domain-containing protein [Alphaproteobacteria bacterium]